jgi:hypothetical protein
MLLLIANLWMSLRWQLWVQWYIQHRLLEGRQGDHEGALSLLLLLLLLVHLLLQGLVHVWGGTDYYVVVVTCTMASHTPVSAVSAMPLGCA